MTEHPNLCAALVAALADLCTVEKGRTANAGSYSYDYADLGDIVHDTRPVLASHGVVALTPLGMVGDQLAVSVVFLHSSGERMDFGPFPFPHGRDAQATGSMVTYHRRYALLAALGMATGEDDDGAAALPRQKEPARVAIPTELAARLDALPGEAQDRLAAWAARAGEPNIRSVPESWVVAVDRAVAAEEKKAVDADKPKPPQQLRAEEIGAEARARREPSNKDAAAGDAA